MSHYPVHVTSPGRLIFVGFGSIGQGVLPLILRHVGIQPDQITVVTAHEAGEKVAAEYGVRFVKHPLTRENFRNVLAPTWWAAVISCSICRWMARASR